MRGGDIEQSLPHLKLQFKRSLTHIFKWKDIQPLVNATESASTQRGFIHTQYTTHMYTKYTYLDVFSAAISDNNIQRTSRNIKTSINGFRICSGFHGFFSGAKRSLQIALSILLPKRVRFDS